MKLPQIERGKPEMGQKEPGTVWRTIVGLSGLCFDEKVSAYIMQARYHSLEITIYFLDISATSDQMQTCESIRMRDLFHGSANSLGRS